MGVYEVREVAEQMTEMLKKEGFSDTHWLEHSGRIDVYTASFDKVDLAQSFLTTLHAKYPHHKDAWIMKR